MVDAGPDFQFSLPLHNFFLDGSATTGLNLANLNLEYEWSCLSHPSSNVSSFIELPGELVTRVFKFDTGIYVFQLKAKYQKLVAYDTVKVVINPDMLKGKSIIYDNLIWSDIFINSGFDDGYHRVGLFLMSPDFYFRDINDLKIEFWDDEMQSWNLILKNDYYFDNPGQLVIFHPDSFNYSLYAKNTKIRVRF